MEMRRDPCSGPTGEIFGPLLRTAEGASSRDLPSALSHHRAASSCSSTFMLSRAWGAGSRGHWLTWALAHMGTLSLSLSPSLSLSYTHTPVQGTSLSFRPTSSDFSSELVSQVTTQEPQKSQSPAAGRDLQHLRLGTAQPCLSHRASDLSGASRSEATKRSKVRVCEQGGLAQLIHGSARC